MGSPDNKLQEKYSGFLNRNPVYPETADIETSSEDYASRFAGSVGSWFLKVQEKASLEMLADYPGCTILDVGGGHGQLTGPLLDNGYTVTVFGSSEVCIERIRQYVDGKRCYFQVGNILDLPYPDRSFDVVISYRLLPHVERWKEYLAELARVANHVVMLDYPEVRSVNSLTPYLFSFKKNLEGNTRTYTVFRQAELIEVFNELGYQHAERYPEFFFPMVLHRKLNAPNISSRIERISRLLGLTGWFGSPVILKMVRSGGVEHEDFTTSSTAILS